MFIENKKVVIDGYNTLVIQQDIRHTNEKNDYN